jgi:DNA-binding transcriptional LysR family regulator
VTACALVARAAGQRFERRAVIGWRAASEAARVVRRASLGESRERGAVWSGFAARLNDIPAVSRARLRVAVVTTAKYFLPKVLGCFVQLHPGIEVERKATPRNRV